MSLLDLTRKLRFIKSEVTNGDKFSFDIVNKEIYWFLKMYDKDVKLINQKLEELAELQEELECIKQIRRDLKEVVSGSTTISGKNASRLSSED